MKKTLMALILMCLLLVTVWSQAQPVARIFMVNTSGMTFFIQVGEDNAWAFKYECPPNSASGMLELDSRFFKTYKVYMEANEDGMRVRRTAMTYAGEGSEGTPLLLELKGGNIYCLVAGYGVSVHILADPPGNDPRICFSNFYMGPPLTRIEVGKAWGKDTAVAYTEPVQHQQVTDFIAFKPGTYNFFVKHPFYEDKNAVLDKNLKPLVATMNKERAYYIFGFYLEQEELSGMVLDVSPAVKPVPELFASGIYKVDLTVSKKVTSISWDLTLLDKKITGTSTENNVLSRLEGIVVGDVLKIVIFKEKELVIFQGTKKGLAIDGKFRIDLKPADAGTWKLKLP